MIDKSVEDMIEAAGRLPRPLVFTNGCFDIIHPGHTLLLLAAYAMGKSLVVGLNSDASVARLKGSGRPLNRLDDRHSVLMCIRGVDAVIPFEEDTPLELIRRIRPDILVKGGDYDAQSVVGYEDVIGYGGRVYTLPYLNDYSTTKLIEKIRNAGR